jgi:tetratricopeptide (TPR) repeat protein
MCLLPIAVLAALSASVGAVEPAEEFLQGLQERELHELALDYLQRLETSKLIGEDFRRQIPYHRGVVLLEQSRRMGDAAARSRLLDEARGELERYAKINPENVQGAEAQLQLASVQMSRAQQLMAQAEQLPREPAYEAQRQELGAEARRLLSGARKTLGQAEAIYSAELAQLPPATSDKEGVAARRQEYRARVAQLKFLAAQTQFDAAQSYPPDVLEFRKLHEAAAKEMATVYDEFARTLIVGLYARLYEGRCYQAIGQFQQALGCYDEILAQPNVLPPFRRLIASAIHRKAELLINQQKFDEAIATATACLRDASGNEARQPEWLAVRFRLAEALQKKAKSLPTATLEQRRSFAEARDAYRQVANSAGEFQADARAAVVKLTRGNSGTPTTRNEPRNFQAAYNAGKDALASYNAAKLAVPSAERNNPAALPELEAQMEQGKEGARFYFRAATLLVDDDTDVKLLNEVRYFLCWLYWESRDFYRAGVLGEFLARRYPNHPAASSAAKISMASFERLYNMAATSSENLADTDFEARRMAQIAEFITRRWPGTEDAEAAQSVLVAYAIRTNNIDEAEKLLDNASSEARPRLQLQLGNAMWGRYLELSQSSGSGPSENAAVARLKTSALKYLRDGFDQARGEGQVSETTAAAGLYLAQALVEDEQHEEAIRLLEDEKAGPLTLVSSSHAVARSAQFPIETYKVALRAYVLATPPRAQKALEVVESLDRAVGERGDGDSQLTQIYIGLGVSLEKQLEQLRAAGRVQEAESVATTFAEFLDRIAARQANANWTTRVWLAQMYQKLAVTSDSREPRSPEPAMPSDVARSFLGKARDAYRRVLDDASKNPAVAPSDSSVVAVKMQLGECYRALGQYQHALDTFSDILSGREASLAVQRAAAYAYQERGQVEEPEWFERAIHGGYQLRSTGQNRIWGWLKISHVAARAMRADDKYRDAFYEARANIARCRYMAAMKRAGADRQRDLARAKQGIQSLAQLYPDLGGERWQGEFDTLLRDIQKAAGEQPAGLREFSAGESQTNSMSPRG